MGGAHWSDDDLIGHLYDAGPDDSHLKWCADCARRWSELVEARARVVKDPDVSDEFLAAQRRAIHRRLESPAGAGGMLLAPGLAMAAVVLLGFLLSAPRPKPQPSLASSDAQWYADIYSVIQSTEPAAVEPVRALFEAQQ